MDAVTRKPRKRRILPGFGLSLGFALTFFGLLVLIPLGGLVLKGTQMSWASHSARRDGSPVAAKAPDSTSRASSDVGTSSM